MNLSDTVLQVLNKIKDLLANNAVCIGVQTLPIGAGVSSLTVPQGTSYALAQVQSTAVGAAIRYWSDGTQPTSIDGLFRGHGDAFDIVSAESARRMLLTQAQAGTHLIFIEYYK